MATKRIALVAGSKHGVAESIDARHFYKGLIFQKSARLVEHLVLTGQMDGWAILSARHGLVLPDEDLEPHEGGMDRMRTHDRDRWGKRVAEDIVRSGLCAAGDAVILYAGRDFRDPLTPWLERAGITHTAPMAGMTHDAQKAWLDVELAR